MVVLGGRHPVHRAAADRAPLAAHLPAVDRRTSTPAARASARCRQRREHDARTEAAAPAVVHRARCCSRWPRPVWAWPAPTSAMVRLVGVLRAPARASAALSLLLRRRWDGRRRVAAPDPARDRRTPVPHDRPGRRRARRPAPGGGRARRDPGVRRTDRAVRCRPRWSAVLFVAGWVSPGDRLAGPGVGPPRLGGVGPRRCPTDFTADTMVDRLLVQLTPGISMERGQLPDDDPRRRDRRARADLPPRVRRPAVGLDGAARQRGRRWSPSGCCPVVLAEHGRRHRHVPARPRQPQRRRRVDGDPVPARRRARGLLAAADPVRAGHQPDRARLPVRRDRRRRRRAPDPAVRRTDAATFSAGRPPRAATTVFTTWLRTGRSCAEPLPVQARRRDRPQGPAAAAVRRRGRRYPRGVLDDGRDRPARHPGHGDRRHRSSRSAAAR